MIQIQLGEVLHLCMMKNTSLVPQGSVRVNITTSPDVFSNCSNIQSFVIQKHKLSSHISSISRAKMMTEAAEGDCFADLVRQSRAEYDEGE